MRFRLIQHAPGCRNARQRANTLVANWLQSNRPGSNVPVSPAPRADNLVARPNRASHQRLRSSLMAEATSDLTLLRNASVFAELPEEALRDLVGLLRKVRLSARRTLFLEGDPSDGCYAIASGSLRVSRFSSDGHETVLAVLGQGEIVGEMSLFGNALRSATVTALTDSELLRMPKDALLRFADNNPLLYRHFLAVLSARLRVTNDALISHTTLPLSGRLARVFVRLSESFGHPLDGGRVLIRHRFTQNDLSHMSGSARENISRQITEWRRDKALTKIGPYYCLEAPATFRRLAGL